ncbi:P-loop containing nucleoside triphosphate hydrolase protein [Xylaria digitata]|nr:P-loop containing nucleoside triphosphate hydrolase protein [Xylaria digitata]
MISGSEVTPGSSEQAQEVKYRCPGSTIKKARKTLKRCHGDVDKAVFHLKSQPEATRPCAQDAETENQQDEDPSSYLQLPTLSQPTPLPHGHGSGFSLHDVIGAIQSGHSLDWVYQYLAFRHKIDSQKLSSSLNSNVQGFPAIFYVVAANNVELIRCWVRYGGNLNATHEASGLPLIAFAILRACRLRSQSTKILRELLSLGADPKVIPTAFYQPFLRELPKSGPTEADLDDIQEDNKLWCKPGFRQLLSAALSILQRYLLDRASRAKPNSGRKRVLVNRKNAEALLGLNLLIIGQEMAAESLKSTLLYHLGMPSREPMVLLFAGPSGHGKTELARKLGDLMSLELHTVDCTMVTKELELFGPKPPFSDYAAGTPLNNFLSRKSGATSVVFLDEFEKTSDDVRNALLIPFDQGEYMDRRNWSEVNCLQTIWILATNAFDREIHEFCELNKDLLENGADLQRSPAFKKLVARLWKECISYFGAPLSGRINEIVPFLRFTSDESAVVADKGIMVMEEEFARPVKGDRLIGNVCLDLPRGSTVCSNIANKHYMPVLGARSIFSGIDRVIARPTANMYLEDRDDFAENQPENKIS